MKQSGCFSLAGFVFSNRLELPFQFLNNSGQDFLLCVCFLSVVSTGL